MKRHKPLKKTPFRKRSTSGTLKRNLGQSVASQGYAKRKPKKPKLPSNRILKKKLWTLCKEIIRIRHGNRCYTCDTPGLKGKNWQTGHGKAKGALPLKYQYDLKNLRPQCYQCNHGGNGMTDIFISKLERETEGLSFLNEACVKEDGLWRIKRVDTMGSTESTLFLLALIEEYKAIRDSLL